MLPKNPVYLAWFLSGVLLLACSEKEPSRVAADLSEPYVIAVNNPLVYFAERLIENHRETRLLAPPDTDPAQWQPTAEEALQLQGAELIFLNGAGYSSWLNKVSVAEHRLVVTSAAARDQWLELQSEVTHSHGPAGEHAHGGYVFTTWLDMELAKTQARSVAQAMKKRWPELQSDIDLRLTALLKDLTSLDEGYKEAAHALREREIIYSHPVYQYFERRYQLQGTSLHWEPGELPDDKQWGELEQLRSPTSLFIWEAQPVEAIVSRMRREGIEYVIVDPAANRGLEDWLTVQRNNVHRLLQIR